MFPKINVESSFKRGMIMIEDASVKLTILCDDSLIKPLFSEHGFSVLVEKDSESAMLFDTGASDVFLRNARILKKDLTKVEKIIISHGHYDHAGGLKYLSEIGKSFTVCVKEETFIPKYSGERFAGIDWQDLKTSFHFLLVKEKVQEISRNIYIFGPVEMKNDFEEPEPNFYVAQAGKRTRDFFSEELNLVIDQGDGVILITGCAHRGIVNTVEDTIKTFGKRIKILIGGFHLYKSSVQKIEKVKDALRVFKIDRIFPYHCTGELATKLLETSH